MCGRYSIVLSADDLQLSFGDALQMPSELPVNYNQAPTQLGLVLTNQKPDRLQLYHWGLVPSWAKDRKLGARMINARREGIEAKASFRKPIRRQRCLVLGDSFYEWKSAPDGKRPFRILPREGPFLVMAGIWERWQPEGANTSYNSYSIITGPPNADMAGLHDRMPMLLQHSEQQSVWLDSDAELDTVLALLQTPPAGTLQSYEVSRAVNSVRNNGAQLHEPVSEGPTLF